MSIISNKGKGGNSSGFAGIHQILNGLQASADGLTGLSVILNSILNATIAHQDMEILLVRDTGNGDLVVQQIREYDETTQTWSTYYQKVDGSPYVAPELVGPLVYLDPSAVLNLILTEMLDQGLTLDNIDTTTASSLVELLAQGLSLDAIVTSTGLSATEATLLLTNALLTTIDADTSNLDVLLSTRASEATLTGVATDLGLIYTNLQLNTILAAQMEANIDASTWDTTIGNTKTFSYYAGVQPGHPAASLTEVQTIAFSDGGGLVFTQTFTYDAANNVLTSVVT